MTGPDSKQDRIVVEYQSGPSQSSDQTGIDFMLAEVDDEIKLYAEMVPPEDEIGSYEFLKNKIVQQALFYHIDPNTLVFPYD